ncbi:phage tail protein [Haloplanus aerogenes]|uniref:Phage tail protein n=1 Tax=Haloplanus aerogenes TaxID=660522 RepID=A0A3M0D3H4_9EURY|nr:phage tail protein [Haloplanus aerogenes]AZH25013.1 phage tail protein [Haloplanus aerogenes]RMB13769.1 phage tail-like protein [Haloplanus aerogenes]
MTDRPVDPYGRHRFDVDLGDDRPPLGFTEVSGLSVRVQARPADDAPEDDNVDWFDWGDRLGRAVGRVPSAPRRRTVSPTLTLRRGVTDDRRLWDWLQDWVAGIVDPRTVRVFLLDAAGERARGWRCVDATPVRWDGPELVADRPAAATETLELAHEGIEAITGDGDE